MKVEKSSGIVVFRISDEERQYLLLERKEGFLDFPKGHIENGETEIEAAMRETLEESGLEVVPRDGFRKEMDYWFKSKGELIHKKVVMFTGEVSNGAAPEISFEHVGLRWLNYEDAVELLKYDNQKELLAEVEKFLSETRID